MKIMDIQAQRQKRLAELLKSKREDMGLSQRAMASRLGFRQATIYQWESQKADPDVASLEKIARFFGMTMDELWKYLNGEDVDRPSDKLDLKKMLQALDAMPKSDVIELVNAGVQKLAQAS
jgi:transcriptional regulator with XRE-family HTH domain